MFTDSHSVLYAALLLPGIFFLCEVMALVMRINLGKPGHPAWRAGAVLTAVIYTLVLSAYVSPAVHTLSRAPGSPSQLFAQSAPAPAQQAPEKWTRPMPWMHWWSDTDRAQA